MKGWITVTTYPSKCKVLVNTALVRAFVPYESYTKILWLDGKGETTGVICEDLETIDRLMTFS